MITSAKAVARLKLPLQTVLSTTKEIKRMYEEEADEESLEDLKKRRTDFYHQELTQMLCWELIDTCFEAKFAGL